MRRAQLALAVSGGAFALLSILFVIIALTLAMQGPASAQDETEPTTIAEINTQPYMNVFRRFDAPAEDMFEFYGAVLGLEQLDSFSDVGAGGVHRFAVPGDAQVKLTARTPNRDYVEGGVDAATGLRLLTFFVPDADAVDARFAAHGLPAPEWIAIDGTTRSAALVEDPDGQPVTLIAAPGEDDAVYEQIEIGLVVSDLAASRAFYGDFVGLEALAPSSDPITGTTTHSYRHGSTIVSLRTFDRALPADTGSGGIQYVVRDAALVDRLAAEEGVTVETPLSTLGGYALTTIWLNDPDGITNYFAQVGGPPPGN